MTVLVSDMILTTLFGVLVRLDSSGFLLRILSDILIFSGLLRSRLATSFVNGKQKQCSDGYISAQILPKGKLLCLFFRTSFIFHSNMNCTAVCHYYASTNTLCAFANGNLLIFLFIMLMLLLCHG